MIQRIQGSEYLQRYDNMTAGERLAYEKRVGEWLENGAPLLEARTEDFEARLQNVLQVSGAWNDQECHAFEEGTRLLSALASTGETWLPDMLYVKSAKRAIRRIVEMLVGITGKQEGTKAQAPFQDGAGDGHIAGGDQDGEGDDHIAGGDQALTVNQGVVPARPKHIDQYVHLLPEKTQEHAALVQGLYRELEDARQKLQLLTDDPKASPADREAWAKKATKCDNALRKIFKELDAEWEKLAKSGRVVVDDLGNARVMDDGRDKSLPDLTSEQKARRRELRKWLVDTRRGNGDTREEHVRKWNDNFKEYLTLEGDAAYKDEKILEAAKHYGIELVNG